MFKLSIIFRRTSFNHYSVSALVGLLDEKLDSKKFKISLIDDLADLKNINFKKPVILAYSFGSFLASKVYKEFNLLRKLFKDKIVIIAGGPHPSGLPSEVLEKGADFVFVGEAEESLPFFLNNFYQDPKSLKERIINPLPLKDFNSYPPFAYKRGFFSPLEIRRGCLRGCFFCQTPYLFRKIRERDLDYVKKYAGYLKKASKKDLYFISPDGLSYAGKNGQVNLNYLEEFLRELSSLGFNLCLGYFPSEIFPRSIIEEPLSLKILKRYVKNKKISIGAQSGSSSLLKLINRKHTVKDVIEAVKIARSYGFNPVVDILFGLPFETYSDRVKTLEFMKKLVKDYQVRLNIHYFIPLPQTPFFKYKPTPLEDKIKEEILLLMKKGIAFGNFFSQLHFSLCNISVSN